MKVRISPLGFIGHVIELGPVRYTVRLANGTLVIVPVGLIEMIK